MAEHLGTRALLCAIAAAVCPVLAGCGDEAGVEDLSDKQQTTRIKALRTLSESDDEQAEKAVGEIMQHKDTRTAREAVRAYSHMTGRRRGVQTLGKVARNDRRPEVRLEATTQLGRKEPEIAKPELYQLTEDPDDRVRAQAIAEIGKAASAEDVPKLLKMAEQADSVRVEAAAVRAVERLIGVGVEYRASDPPDERRKAVGRLRHWAQRVLEAGGIRRR